MITANRPLARVIGGAGFFALAFGSIIGSGWVVVLGDWLKASGPGGAVLGFAAGTVLMAIVAAAYAELLARCPRAGSEFTFILEGLGTGWAHVVGWFIGLYIVAFTAFEALALTWFLEILIPPLATGPIAYNLLGQDVPVFTLVIGISGAIVLTLFNSIGAQVAIGFQQLVTFAFIGVSAALILLGFWNGTAVNWQPLFKAPAGESLAGGILWIFAGSTLFLSGFQSAANAVEERAVATGFRTVAWSMIGAVVAAGLFYCLIILASSALRPWQELPSQALPVTAAFESALPNGLAARMVLIAATISLIKTWNALHLSASRLLLAQARSGLLPSMLQQVDPGHGIPRNAVLFVGAVTCFGVSLGRGAIIPIINMSTVCVAVTVVLCLVALLHLRGRLQGRPEFRVFGGTFVIVLAMIGASGAAVMAAVAPFSAADGMPLELKLLAGWALLGALLVAFRKFRDARGRGH